MVYASCDIQAFSEMNCFGRVLGYLTLESQLTQLLKVVNKCT